MLLPVILLAFLGTTTAQETVECGSAVEFTISVCSDNTDGKLTEKPPETPTPPAWFCVSSALVPGEIVPIQIRITNNFKTNDGVPIPAQTVGGSSLLVYFSCASSPESQAGLCYLDVYSSDRLKSVLVQPSSADPSGADSGWFTPAREGIEFEFLAPDSASADKYMGRVTFPATPIPFDAGGTLDVGTIYTFAKGRPPTGFPTIQIVVSAENGLPYLESAYEPCSSVVPAASAQAMTATFLMLEPPPPPAPPVAEEGDEGEGNGGFDDDLDDDSGDTSGDDDDDVAALTE